MWPDARTTITIGGRLVSPGAPLFTVAEIGLNHGGSLEKALAMVEAAAAAGASAVKVQAVVARDLVARGCAPPAHVDARSMQEFFARFELRAGDYARIAECARSRGLAVIATPLSRSAVDMLDAIGFDAYKIASGDLTWDGLIARCASTGKPLILSTGMACDAEIAGAVSTARHAGAREIALLHCVSAYPVPEGQENLRAIARLAATFGTVVGLSDHGPETSSVPLAVALGASMWERHFVLAGDDSAIDFAVSSDPGQLADAIRAAAWARRVLGSGAEGSQPAEAPNRAVSRRGLYARRPIRRGETITAADITVLRPFAGLGASRAGDLVGIRSMRDVPRGAPFLESDISTNREMEAYREIA